MLRNFLKISFRHLIRKKAFFAINIFGLTAGLVSCILIGLYVSDELSFDRFHANACRIVRMTMEFQKGNSSTPNHVATCGTKPGPQFKRLFPIVENYVRTMEFPVLVSAGTETFTENRFLYADPSFFSIFSFPLLKGDPAALSVKSNIVITASAAKKYFGTTDALGKTLRVNDRKDFRVSAVAQDPPGNSQLHFDFI